MGNARKAENVYPALYWAAACLMFWAGGSATKGQMAHAIDKICDEAELSVPEEALVKKIVQDMMDGKGEKNVID